MSHQANTVTTTQDSGNVPYVFSLQNAICPSAVLMLLLGQIAANFNQTSEESMSSFATMIHSQLKETVAQAEAVTSAGTFTALGEGVAGVGGVAGGMYGMNGGLTGIRSATQEFKEVDGYFQQYKGNSGNEVLGKVEEVPVGNKIEEDLAKADPKAPVSALGPNVKAKINSVDGSGKAPTPKLSAEDYDRNVKRAGIRAAPGHQMAQNAQMISSFGSSLGGLLRAPLDGLSANKNAQGQLFSAQASVFGQLSGTTNETKGNAQGAFTAVVQQFADVMQTILASSRA